MAANTNVTIKSMTEDTVRVAGYGVIFGGVDLEGETFGPDTDYMLDLVPDKLVLYDHGQNKGVKGTVIGRIKSDDLTIDDDGLWIEAELDRHAAYVSAIIELAEKGVLGWSSGSVGHLTAREGKSIKRWPIVEFSLTATPAEPRTLGVDVLKALADTAPILNELSIGEADADPVDIDESEQTEPEAGTPEDDRSSSAPAGKSTEDSPDDAAYKLRLELELMELED